MEVQPESGTKRWLSESTTGAVVPKVRRWLSAGAKRAVVAARRHSRRGMARTLELREEEAMADSCRGFDEGEEEEMEASCGLASGVGEESVDQSIHRVACDEPRTRWMVGPTRRGRAGWFRYFNALISVGFYLFRLGRGFGWACGGESICTRFGPSTIAFCLAVWAVSFAVDISVAT